MWCSKNKALFLRIWWWFNFSLLGICFFCDQKVIPPHCFIWSQRISKSVRNTKSDQLVYLDTNSIFKFKCVLRGIIAYVICRLIWTGLKWFISIELAWVHYHYHFRNLFLKLVDHYHVTGIERVCILTTLPLSQKSFFPGILWHYYWVWVRMRTMGLRKWSFVTAKAVLIFVC